jgi:hypothetical protein
VSTGPIQRIHECLIQIRQALKKPPSVDEIVDERFSAADPQAERIKRRLARKRQQLAKVK